MEKYVKLSDAIEELDRLVRTKQIEIIHGNFENIEKHFEDMSKNNPLNLQVSLQGADFKTKYRFIHFVEGLKDEWTVWTNKKDEYLGLITFHKKWKEWEFTPENYTGYTLQCLLDLADFIKQLKAPQSN